MSNCISTSHNFGTGDQPTFDGSFDELLIRWNEYQRLRRSDQPDLAQINAARRSLDQARHHHRTGPRAIA